MGIALMMSALVMADVGVAKTAVSEFQAQAAKCGVNLHARFRGRGPKYAEAMFMADATPQQLVIIANIGDETVGCMEKWAVDRSILFIRASE